MKKKVLFSGIAIATILVVCLNLYMTKESENTFQASALIVEETGKPSEAIVLSNETLAQLELETIHAIYQRKVGAPEQKTYQGISLANILKAAGVTEENATQVAISSRDQYQIVLPVKEAFESEHAYLVLYEGEVPLKEEEGDYMLVLCKDAISSRWVKQVVSIQWTRADYEQ